MKTFKTGDLVRYSQHYLGEHKWNAERFALMRGIVVGVETYRENGEIIQYPRIHWSGAPSESTCHPMNADVVALDEKPVEPKPAEPTEIAAALALLAREAQRWEGVAKQYKHEHKGLSAEIEQLKEEIKRRDEADALQDRE